MSERRACSLRGAALALSAVLLLGACANDDSPTIDASGSPTAGTAVPTAAASTEAAPVVEATPADIPAGTDVALAAELTGNAEVPGPGDDGQGSFTGTLAVVEEDGRTVQLCYELRTSGLTMAPAAAHVHRGASAEAGEVVVPLEAPTGGSASGCADVRPGDAARMMATPAAFYVNVHTDDYPDGAVRGQLAQGG